MPLSSLTPARTARTERAWVQAITRLGGIPAASAKACSWRSSAARGDAETGSAVHRVSEHGQGFERNLTDHPQGVDHRPTIGGGLQDVAALEVPMEKGLGLI